MNDFSNILFTGHVEGGFCIRPIRKPRIWSFRALTQSDSELIIRGGIPGCMWQSPEIWARICVLYIYIYIHTYISLSLYIYIYIHTHISLSIYIYIYIHTYMHTCIHTYIHIHIYTYILDEGAIMSLSLSIYIYTQYHIYVYIYIYIYVLRIVNCGGFVRSPLQSLSERPKSEDPSFPGHVKTWLE